MLRWPDAWQQHADASHQLRADICEPRGRAARATSLDFATTGMKGREIDMRSLTIIAIIVATLGFCPTALADPIPKSACAAVYSSLRQITELTEHMRHDNALLAAAQQRGAPAFGEAIRAARDRVQQLSDLMASTASRTADAGLRVKLVRYSAAEQARADLLNDRLSQDLSQPSSSEWDERKEQILAETEASSRAIDEACPRQS